MTMAFEPSAGLVSPGSVVVYLTGETLNAAAGYGPFPASGSPYLRVFCNGRVGVARARVTINWYADEDMTQSLGSDVMITPTGNNTARQSYPVRGSWVRFVLDASAYPQVISLHAFLTNQATSDNTGSTGTNFLVAVDGSSVAAGATRTDDAISSRGGPAYWRAVFDGGAAGLIRLYTVDHLGNTRLLDVMGPTISKEGQRIYLPCAPVRIVATNGDAAARNYYAVVYHQLPPL